MPHDLNEIYLMLGEIRAELKALRSQQDDINTLKEDYKEVCDRVTKLEGWRTALLAGATVLGFLGALIMKLLAFLV